MLALRQNRQGRQPQGSEATAVAFRPHSAQHDLADDPLVVLDDHRDLDIAIPPQLLDEIGFGAGREGHGQDRPDCCGVIRSFGSDREVHTSEMSGASSCFMPTTL